ncbi:MAG: ABC transporter substrate-binding protein [Pseudomonadota bacterium]
MKKNRKVIAIILTLLMLAGIVSGCKTTTSVEAPAQDSSVSEATTAPKDKDTLTMLSAESFTGSWDPTGHTILANIHVEYIVFDRLVNMDMKTLEISPGLATEWKYLEDGVTLELKLREGVKFHDGTDLDASDVAETIKRFSDKSRVASAWWAEPILTEVVDNLTVRLKPSSGKPYAPLLNNLCFTPILSSDDIKDEKRLMNNLNGTGPYKFVKFENEQCDFVANENYWDKPNAAKIKNFIFRYVADPATRLAALQTGEADIIERVESEQVPTIKADSNLKYITETAIEQKNLVFKFQVPPMDNKLLRQAISYAIDRDTIVKDIMQGYATPSNNFISEVAWAYAPADGFPTYDPEKAKKLLAEAGYPDGKGLPELTYATSVGFYPKTKEYGEYIVSNLAAIGIKVKLVPMETASWLDALYQPKSAHMIDTGWMPPGLEPDLTIGAFYRSPGQVAFCEIPELNNILTEESQITDSKARAEFLKKSVYPMIAENVPHMTLFNSVLIYAMRSDVEGFEPTPTSAMPFQKVYFK